MESFQKILSNRTTTTKPTFKSFVTTTNGGGGGGGVLSSSLLSSSGRDNNDHANNYSTNNAEVNIQENSCALYDGTDDCSEIILPQGEILIGRVDEVLRSLLYSPTEDGPRGTLLVTNFRVIFVPKDRSTADRSKSELGRCNKLIGREDIALSNIFAVFHVSKGKKKKLLPNSFMSKIVKRLQIHCKDFRLHQFCFEKCFQDQVKVLVNAILHHFFPVYVEKLFAFTYVDKSSADDVVQSSVREFMTADDWQSELERLGVRNSRFSVSDCNKEFKLSESLPEYFVLPSSLSSAQLKKTESSLDGTCLPVWSYSHANGCALVRTAYGHTETENVMKQYVAHSHPRLVHPELFDLGCTTSGLPSLKKLQTSFEELLEICMPSSYKELVNSDCSWYSALDLSQWMSYVSCALQVAVDVAETISSNCRSVIVKEKSGTDFNALISSLVQLLLDSECRKIHGFQTLVEKEFVALGHRFSQRGHVVSSKDAEQSPVFLLFLNCTWQLLQQFPSSFEFSEIFLISVWDSAGLGIFRNFIFDGPKERTAVEASIRDNSTLNQTFPMNVWDWRKQFFPEDITFFTNPLYSAQEQFRNFQLKKSQSELDLESQVLMPCCDITVLKFWENCYLRWLTPIQIVGGGKPSEIVAQGLIMEEITSLQMKISELEEVLADKLPSAQRRRAMKFIYGDSSSLLRHKLSKHVSSSYPFSPMQSLTHTLLLPVPSPDSRSSLNDDSASLDELTIDESTYI